MTIYVTYVNRYILACWRNYFCHAKAKVPSLFIVGVHVVLKNTHVFSLIM